LQDSAGNRFGQSPALTNSSDAGSNVTTTWIVFEDEINGCLFFFIEDSQGDGIIGGGYTLTMNQQVLAERSGNFRDGERMTIPLSPLCLQRVLPSSLIRVSITLDSKPTETSWSFGNRTGGLIESWQGEQDEARTTVSFVYDPITSNNPETCYTFSIMDTGGDGICCGFGIGFFTIRLGWTLLLSRRTGEFGYAERVRFGTDCPTEIVDGYAAELNLTMDFRPNETSWQMQELATGTILGGIDGDSYDNLTRRYIILEDSFDSSFVSPVRINQFFFRYPEASTNEDCLEFVIRDVDGDGICCDVGNGTFSLSVDGNEAYRSNGMFGAGENVVFGKNCTTTVNTIANDTISNDTLVNNTIFNNTLVNSTLINDTIVNDTIVNNTTGRRILLS